LRSGRTIVLDIGKSNVKASLWEAGRCMDVVAGPAPTPLGQALDVEGMERWVESALRRFATTGPVEAIVPVAHGATAVLVAKGKVFAPPRDYEADVPAAERAAYERERDPFEHTGSPALPAGLNLGLQLHHLERAGARWPKDLKILLWPQYWAWRLCGVLASEVTSLGCHTDLWDPLERQYSRLAQRRGWAARFPRIRQAFEPLGTLAGEWAERTGLPTSCRVYCGLHDSNAALVAARGHARLSEDMTVLSTGTWFVAMRSLPKHAPVDLSRVPAGRDCLVNVDILAQPVPSARFMGGRELELLAGVLAPDTGAECLRCVPDLVRGGVYAYPSFVPGVGPFPAESGRWQNKPATPTELAAAAQLYLALMADTSLSLIGSRGSLLIEGRFAAAGVFTRALASLRPQQQVYVCDLGDGVAYGAQRLLDPGVVPPGELRLVEPLPEDLSAYADKWRAGAGRAAE
jgi:sugar (pentulose or hexulose) kinase